MNEIFNVFKDMYVSYAIVFTTAYYLTKLGGIFFGYSIKIVFK